MSRLARAFGYFSFGLGISLLIGYWLKQEELRNRKLISQEPAAPQTPAEPHIILSQKTLDSAAEHPKDDLTRINGIGPKTAEALYAIGITSYAMIASASVDNLLEKLHDVRGVTAEKIESWKAQAAEITS